ncbi:MAG: hypothetical protein KHW53_05665, partial [Veillonella sp.]|uniref:hypothetical protein n=1 Tax=Veillonella sp. TaxID=1926307 RepID=UPI002580F2BC
KGQNDITRYEMAQMVAKAMANQDRANAEQQAMINRLADEFSNELNNLGVRVARLEDRVGNVKVTGDMRIKWEDQEHASSDTNGRARIQFNAKVNDRTEAVARIKGAYTFGDANGSTAVSLDRAYVNHKFGERVSAKAGRFGQTFGSGLAYDSTFDGAQFNAGNDKVAFQAAYGYLTSSNVKTTAGASVDKDANDSKALGVKAEDGGSANYNVYKNVYGFNANTNFDKVWVGGEWVKASNVKDSTAWTAGVGYGNYSIAKKGSWDVKGQYFNAKENAPVFDSTWNHKYIQNAKGWMASVDYALQPNVGLSAYYGFDWKTADSAKTDKADFYRAELNYKF